LGLPYRYKHEEKIEEYANNDRNHGDNKDGFVDVSACKVQEVMNRHVESGLQKCIHYDIRRFITDGSPFMYRGNDLVVEKMIDLIKRFSVPPAAIRRSA